MYTYIHIIRSEPKTYPNPNPSPFHLTNGARAKSFKNIPSHGIDYKLQYLFVSIRMCKQI